MVSERIEPSVVKLEEELTIAEEARKAADVEKLFALYKKARDDSVDLLKAMGVVLAIGNEKLAMVTPVEALERVARDAIALARDFLRVSRDGQERTP